MNASQPKKTPGLNRGQAFLGSFRFVHNPIGVISEYLQKFGDTYSSYIGGIFPIIVSSNPAFIQHILQKNHRNYIKSPMHFEKLTHFIGNGLLTSEGDYWLRQRRLIQPGFHRKKLTNLTTIMLEVIQEFMDRFDQQIQSGQEIDIHPSMQELAFRIVASSLFSEQVEEELIFKLSNNITTLQAFIAKQIRQPYYQPLFKINGQLKKHEQIANDSNQIILKNIKERQTTGKRHDDLLQMLLDTRYEDTGEGMTEKQLLEESIILFVAGHETSANALAWTWYLLSRHPDCVEKIRQEIADQLGDRLPTFEDLPKLKYILQVVEESMRLYPPAWVTDRVALADDQVNGIKIPKGVIVAAYIYGAHHNADNWPNPEEFRPERFNKANKKDQLPFSYLPFGGGPRLCIGNSFALMEMQLVLACMVPRYDFELVENQVIEPQPLITLRPKYGIKMRFSRR